MALSLALVVAGCSSGPQAAVEQSPATVLATAESDPIEAEPPADGAGEAEQEGALRDGKHWPRPLLAGMYAYHPEQMFPSEEHRGIVSIEPPCVYLYYDPEGLSAAYLDLHGLSANETRWRLALSLPYPMVRFDESTHTLWSGDIPISHGDRILAGGGDGRSTEGGKEPHELHLFWNACTAQGVGGLFGLESVEWYCAQEPPDWPSAKQERQRICVEDTRPWNQRDLLEQQGLAPVGEPPLVGDYPGEPPPIADLLPPQFFGMHPYHSDMELELSKLVGMLTIGPAGPNDYERVCAYLYPMSTSTPQGVLWGDSWKHTGPDGRPLAVRLDLPYPQVRFDQDTWTLWNGDIGPMATGDRVIADPTSPPDFNDNGYGGPKQPHEPVINDPCDKANARATVLDIQPVEHYCTHDTPARHQSQCEQAMSLRHQPEYQLALPE